MRVLYCKDVWENILRTMVDPIRAEADVFAVMKTRGSHLGPPKCVPDPEQPEPALRELMRRHFDIKSLQFRHDQDGEIAIRSVGAPCMHLIEMSESLMGHPYKYVMYLRGDVVYKYSLPGYARWPERDPSETFLYVPDCVHKDRGRCIAASAEEQTLGCVTDTWGLMTRATASIYFPKKWDWESLNSEAKRKTGRGCSPTHVYECGLGCAMHQENVSVQAVQRRGKILHNDLPRPGDVQVEGEISLEAPSARLDASEGEEEDAGVALFMEGSGELVENW